MKSITLFIICFFITKCGFSQYDEIDSFYQAKITSLIHDGVDTVVFYSPCHGLRRYDGNDSCIIYDKKFLLWKRKSELFVWTHFYCINVNNNSSAERYVSKGVSSVDSLNIFDFLRTNFAAVIKDTLLYGLLKTECNGFTVYYRPLGSHDCHTSIIVFAGGKRFRNGYQYADLNDGALRNVDGSIREQRESLNYRYNTSRPIYLMITKIESVIEDLEKSKRL